MKTKLGESIIRGEFEAASDERLFQIKQSIVPLMGPHWNLHSNLFIKRIGLSRILYFNNLYSLIKDIPGVICEFGVQWGASLSLLINLRGMIEPYNYSRKIVGFDTFSGFEATHVKDGDLVSKGDYSTIDSYCEQLEEILLLQESFSPLSHIKKFELVKGDASVTINEWIERNPHAIISMAIFDMDVYQPTKDVLEKIIPRLVKGSVLVFDEVNCPKFPGETLALMEVLGLNKIKLRRDPNQPYCAWAVFE